MLWMETGAHSDPLPDSSARSADKADEFARYVRSLTLAEQQLIRLRNQLYDGSWEAMLGDLGDRLVGRPYIFKLVRQIEEDIQSIQKLQSYELKHEIDLHDFLAPDS